MEQLLGKLPQTKCRYEDCQFKRAEVDVVHQHETDCLFRLVECAFCQDGIPLSKLPDHLQIDHKKKSITLKGLGEEKEMHGGKLYNGQVELKCNNLTFFLNQLSGQDNLVMFWISFCGGQEEAEQYEYTLKIKSSAYRKAGRTVYLFTGSRQCMSCEVSHEDMKKRKEAVLIDEKLLAKAAEGNDDKETLQYTVIVVKKQ